MSKGVWQEVIPERSGNYPEIFDVKEEIRKISDDIGYSNVIDFGCGHGRLCESFHPDRYLGIDADQKAIDVARSKFLDYRFDHVGQNPRFADIYLAYSVFLKMNDTKLHEALKNIRCKWLILAESLGDQWKQSKSVPIYSRQADDYVQILRSHDLVLHKKIIRPAEKDSKDVSKKHQDQNISFLVFRKCMRNPLA